MVYYAPLKKEEKKEMEDVVASNERLFEVDPQKCVKCALCVKDCAFGALRTDDSGAPVMAKPDACMRCQHCLAICPSGAVTFDGISPHDCVLTKGMVLPDLTSTTNWLRSRRSIRRFAAADVERETLDAILRVLANSPTGCNARSLTFTCISSREAMAKFKSDFITTIENHRERGKLLPRWLAVPAIRLRKGGSDIFFRDAPGMLIVSSDDKNPAVTTPREDVAIACSHFELLANSAGLGTCWCGFLNLVQKEVPEILESTLGLSRTAPFYAMLFGKPAVRYSRCVKRDAYAQIVYR